MAYFELIQEILDNNDDIYAYICEDGDVGGNVLQIDGDRSMEKLEKLLWEEFQTRGIDTSDFDYHYDPNASYNDACVDFATDGNYVYTDDSFLCDECGQLYRTDDYYANYYMGDGYIVCEDCVHSNPEDYVQSLINDPERANTILSVSELYDLGFEQLNEHYANGWYGREDDPKQIYDNLVNQYGYDAEILFSIEKTRNPFQTDFDVFVRNIDEDYDDEYDEYEE